VVGTISTRLRCFRHKGIRHPFQLLVMP
jgi:hypothetical protein